MRRKNPCPRSIPGEGGFTLVEALISLAILVLFLAILLTLLQSSTSIARVQMHVADMQQGQRVSQYGMVRWTRMAGRGGMPVGVLPGGLALAVRNNAAAGDDVGEGAGPAVMEGTDVLTVRGVFTNSIYQVNYSNSANFTLTPPPPAAPTGGQIVLSDPIPSVGIRQRLGPLIEAVNEGHREALILVSPLSTTTYGVVELDAGGSDVSDPKNLVIAFNITPELNQLSGGVYPAALTNAAYVAILEEYRYYIREEVAPDQVAAKLSRARVFPTAAGATATPWAGDAANWRIDVADNMVDLQVALGIDTNADGTVSDNNDAADEWLYNHEDDDDADPAWNAGRLYAVRLTTVARTDRRDPRYQAPLVELVEDHDYTGSPLNQREERMFRRRFVQTLVDLRNLG